MTEDTDSPRGAAAWQDQRAAIAKRNAEARKRGQAEKRTRDRAVEARDRVKAAAEVKELDELNAALDKRSDR